MMHRKLRVLLAEESTGMSAEILRSIFEEGGGELQLTIASTLATLIPSVKVADPEIILLDLAVGMRDPMDAVHLVHRSAPGVPLVVLADPNQKQYAAQSLSEGAMDYILKGFMDSRTLDRVLRGALERNTFEGLADLLRDPVTGLYARDGLLTLGTRCQEEAQRTGGKLALLCALFENLGTLRAGFGPGAGDQALRDVSGILIGICRRSDVIARLGDSQFAILAVDADGPTVGLLRHRLESTLEQHNRSRSPWGPIEMRSAVGLWSGKPPKPFGEFLDEVETELRSGAHLLELSGTPTSAASGG